MSCVDSKLYGFEIHAASIRNSNPRASISNPCTTKKISNLARLAIKPSEVIYNAGQNFERRNFEDDSNVLRPWKGQVQGTDGLEEGNETEGDLERSVLEMGMWRNRRTRGKRVRGRRARCS